MSRRFPFAVVIIGAGAGTRFGEPKASAHLPNGATFLEAVAATARDAQAQDIVAVLPPNTDAPPGVRVVVNANPKSEQITSTRHGLMALANTDVVGALLWPVDHPFVTLESVLAVLDCAQRTDAPIVVPSYEQRRGHPTWFARATWRELMTVADGGARAVMANYAAAIEHVVVRDGGVRRDIDFPSDLHG